MSVQSSAISNYDESSRLTEVNADEMRCTRKGTFEGKVGFASNGFVNTDDKHTVDGSTEIDTEPTTPVSNNGSTAPGPLSQEQWKFISLLNQHGNKEAIMQHLRHPVYAKISMRRRGFKRFRKFFLAQELKPPINDSVAQDLPNPAIDTAMRVSPTRNGATERKRPIWVMKFSKDGKYMATAGKDHVLHIWKVLSTPMERWGLDESQIMDRGRAKTINLLNNHLSKYNRSDYTSPERRDRKHVGMDLYAPVFHPSPYRTLYEHTEDILDCDWSKNSFLLTASMDKSVKLWHCDRKSSLKTFEHPDFVTCVKFHPSDDRFFLSGCLDTVLRVWSILDAEVTFSFNCGDLITAMSISPDGRYVLVGTFNGYIYVLYVNGLEEYHRFHLLDKAHKQNKKNRRGPKITGIQFIEGKSNSGMKIMITSNDSRIRIFDMDTFMLQELLQGFTNETSQISADYAVMGNATSIVISASESHSIHAWILHGDDEYTTSPDTSSMTTKSSDVSMVRLPNSHQRKNSMKLIGSIKNILKKALKKPKQNDSQSIARHTPIHHVHHNEEYYKNTDCITLHASNHNISAAIFAPSSSLQVLSLSNDLISEMTVAFADSKADYQLAARKALFGHKTSSFEGDYEKAKNPGNKTTPLKQSIGLILVFADTSGIIRVYRHDISNNIRTKVLKMLQGDQAAGIFTEQNTSNSIAPSRTSMTMNTMKAKFSKPLSNTLGKSKLCPHESRSTTSLSSIPKLQPPLAENHSEQTSKTVAGSLFSTKGVCNICGGDRIAFTSTAANEPINRHCLDCGNQINRFR
ncbi:HBL023Wp [Eremothecium sinecaudum]|uniref:HBL023Wp n=1 Tax=Eremothecium sinecaudum TaxID=45286 RepID=A0A109UWM2_9SACH|nr:HBL023Wp [Eremothecium sinecaudum]AMD18879.1 HBL023Wp [Eremothecium sinecaudum]